MNSETCKCGRSYTHCRICGGRNPYYKKFLSLEKSAKLGYSVTVRRCQTCGNETDESMPCIAPRLEGAKVPYNPVPKPADNRPQFVLTPNTQEYIDAWILRYTELADSHKYNSPQAIRTFMEKEGWTTPPLEEDDSKLVKMPEPPANVIEEHELTLDEVLEKMKKEQR